MSSIEKLNFIKITNWKLFGKIFMTKEEAYNETSSEGEPFQILVTPEYFKSEFEINKGEQNGKQG